MLTFITKKSIIKEIKQSLIKVFVFYESPKRLIDTLEFLKEELVNFNICVCSDLTKLHEKVYYGNINKVLEELDYECECNLMKSQVPSLGQFQINVAMGLAKKYHKNMRAITERMHSDDMLCNPIRQEGGAFTYP